jgi:K+-sensing histidine kinase KdpD
MTAATSDQTQPRADRAPFRISLANAQRYLLALIMVGIVIVIRLGIARIDPDLAHPYLLFPLAILISAWVGGFGPGILATVIATVAIDYFFLEPYYSLGLEHPAQWIAQSVNFVQGLIISGLAGSKRRLMGLLQQSRDELEQRPLKARSKKTTARSKNCGHKRFNWNAATVNCRISRRLPHTTFRSRCGRSRLSATACG